MGSKKRFTTFSLFFVFRIDINRNNAQDEFHTKLDLYSIVWIWNWNIFKFAKNILLNSLILANCLLLQISVINSVFPAV